MRKTGRDSIVTEETYRREAGKKIIKEGEMEENQVSDVSASAGSQTNANSEQEKLFTRDELAKIANAQSAKAVAQAKREAEEKHQRDIEALNETRSKQEQRNEQVPKEVDANAIYQQVQEKFNQEMQQQKLKTEMTQVAQNYLSKLDQGRTAYEDFDEVTKDFDPTVFPQITFLLSGIENAGDVLYDLAKNPLKIAGLDRLAEKNPKQAHSELLKLSKSIADNKQAQADAQGQDVAEPLDRLQPSRVSGSNGKMGIRDLRNQPWLKG